LGRGEGAVGGLRIWRELKNKIRESKSELTPATAKVFKNPETKRRGGKGGGGEAS